jgi:GDP-mannose pyrophosphatase NudK
MQWPTTNPRVKITDVTVLSDNWYVLRKASFEFQHSDGHWTSEHREAYDRGNGATVLLFDRVRRTVILTRQFRMPAYLNGLADGMLIETPGGLMDDGDEEALTTIRRELEEETGYVVQDLTQIYDVYMSPGSVTERVVFFTGAYSDAHRTADGGGHAHEGEDIEVLELALDEAAAMIADGRIRDGKTIMLLQWAMLQDRHGA